MRPAHDISCIPSGGPIATCVASPPASSNSARMALSSEAAVRCASTTSSVRNRNVDMPRAESTALAAENLTRCLGKFCPRKFFEAFVDPETTETCPESTTRAFRHAHALAESCEIINEAVVPWHAHTHHRGQG